METEDELNIRFGLAGPGKVADQWLAPALSRASLAVPWSVLGRNIERARAFALKHGFCAPESAYVELDAFLQDSDLAAVLIAAPDDQHCSLAEAVLKSGRPVFIEKPMCGSVAEASHLVDLAEHMRLCVGIGYHLRFHKGLCTLVERVQDGAIGTPLHMRVSWTYRTPDRITHWRALGRQTWWSLGAFGTHALDLIRWTLLPLCGEVVHVGGVISGGIWGTGMDETAVGLLQFASGATAELMSSALFDSEPLVEIIGTRGRAIARQALNSDGTGWIEVNGKHIDFDVQAPYEAQMEAFALCARDGHSPPVGCIEGLRNIQIMEMIVSKGTGPNENKEKRYRAT